MIAMVARMGTAGMGFEGFGSPAGVRHWIEITSFSFTLKRGVLVGGG